jgi:WD40 repeat protein/serine/threonine protein kinase
MSATNADGDSFYDDINLACERFEAEWQSAGEPKIEHFVAQVPEAARTELTRELLKLEIYYRRNRGDTIGQGDYTPRFPEHAILIDTLLSVGSSAEASAKLTHAGGYRLDGLIGSGGMGEVYRTHDPELHGPLAVKILKKEFKDRPEMVARFLEEARLTGQLQHPGVPPVHELGRLLDGRPFLSMKLIEGRTLADLLAKRKPVGQVSNLPEEQEAGWKPAPQDLPRFLTIFEHICQTVACAHSRRIIHRDLKPANVMVGEFGEVQVMDWGLAKTLTTEERKLLPSNGADKLTAFPAEQETVVARTQLGRPMGTWPYMPPEQARGEWDKVDERSDVFSLGATLCEILTGKPAYRGTSENDVRQHAESADLADAFTRLDACETEPELVTLTKRCLSNQPADRPGTAAALAEAVTAYQAGVQERLRRAELDRTEAEVKAKESRKRRRVAVALGSAVVLVLLLGLAATLSQYQQVVQKSDDLAEEIGLKEIALGNAQTSQEEAKTRAAGEREARLAETAAKNDAQRRLAIARHSVMTAQLLRAATLLKDEPDKARELLDDCEKCPLDLRDFTWAYYHGPCKTDGREAFVSGRASCAAFTLDGTTMASGCTDGTIELRGLAVRWCQNPIVLKGHKTSVVSLAFSADGRTLASGSEDKTVRLWDWVAGKELAVLSGHTRSVLCVSFSPDGKTLASGSYLFSGSYQATDGQGEIKLWDAATGKYKQTLRGHTRWVLSVAFTPDSKIMASGGGEGTIKLWDLVTGQERTTLKAHYDHVKCLAFSPDGKLLASGSGKGTHFTALRREFKDRTDSLLPALPENLKLWEVATGKEYATLKGHRSEVDSVTFAPDGTILASGGDETVRLWDVLTGEERGRLDAPWWGTVSFSADGKTLLCSASGNTVKVLTLASTPEWASFKGVGSPVVFSADGRLLATGSEDLSVHLFDTTTGRRRATLRGHTTKARFLAFNTEGNQLVSFSEGFILMGHNGVKSSPPEKKLWDVASGEERRRFSPGNLTPAAMSSGNIMGRPTSPTPDDLKLTPDGKSIITAFLGTVDLIDIDTEQTRLTIERSHLFWRRMTETVCAVHGKTLAVAGIELPWLETPQDSGLFDLVASIVGWAQPTPGAGACWSSPYLPVLAFALDAVPPNGADNGVSLRDLVTGKEVRGFDGVGPIAFSFDGRLLAAAGPNGTVRLWDVNTGTLRATLQGHSKGGMWSAAFSPDGKTLATGSGDEKLVAHVDRDFSKEEEKGWGEVKLWDIATGRCLATFDGHTGPVTSLAFSPDVMTLASGSRFEVKLWDLGRSNVRLIEQERDGLRKQALFWQRVDLAAWTKLAEDPKEHARIRQALQYWQKDAELAGVPGPEAVAKLPADEQEACMKLWADLAALRKKVEEKK